MMQWSLITSLKRVHVSGSFKDVYYGCSIVRVHVPGSYNGTGCVRAYGCVIGKIRSCLRLSS